MIINFLILCISKIACLYMACKFINFLWLKWFNGTTCYYSNIKEDSIEFIPVEFERDGNKYKVFVKYKNLNNQIYGTEIERSDIYINDNLVIRIYNIKKMFVTKRFLDINPNYNREDIFKILKWTRKHHHKEWNRKFEEECNNGKLIKTK